MNNQTILTIMLFVFVISGSITNSYCQTNTEIITEYGTGLIWTYNPSDSDIDYIAETHSGVSDTSQYAKDRDIDKGLIYFLCSEKRQTDFSIPKEKIINVIHIKHDITVYGGVDYAFTQDTVYEIHTSTSNAGIFTSSHITLIPNLKNHLDYYSLFNKDNCVPNKDLFFLTLNFCRRNRIIIKL